MKCVNCGAGLTGEILGSLTKCDFCGSANAFIKKIEISVNDPTLQLGSGESSKLASALNDIEAEEYEDAYFTLSDLADTKLNNWQVQTNLAICKFWLGDDDFSHLSDVLKHLRKSLALCPEPSSVAPYIRSIAFNVAQVAAAKNRYGMSLLNCIDALEKTVQLVDDYPERDELINTFVKTNQESLCRELLTLIKREKKNFDPPRTITETIFKLIALSPRSSEQATALAIIACEKKTISALSIPSSTYERIKSEYLMAFNRKRLPALEFPLFSEARITY